MAAHCPNPTCNRRLRLNDWRQTCPDCGANILYFGMEERLETEADRVELAYAFSQKKFDRAKAALIGSKLAITRLVLLILPLPALLLPLGKLVLAEKNITLNIIGIVKEMGSFGDIFSMLGSLMQKTQLLWFSLAVFGLFLVVAAIFAGLFTCFLACSPKWFARNAAIPSIGMAGVILFGISLTRLGQMSNMIGVAISPGILGILLAFAMVLIINIVIKEQGGVLVQYKPCFIDGIPEEEVLAFLAKGGTVQELREQKMMLAESNPPEWDLAK